MYTSIYETLPRFNRRHADVFAISLVTKLAIAKMTDFITFHIWSLQTVCGYVSRNQSASEHKSELFPASTTKVLNEPRRVPDSTMRQTCGHTGRWMSCQKSWVVWYVIHWHIKFSRIMGKYIFPVIKWKQDPRFRLDQRCWTGAFC